MNFLISTNTKYMMPASVLLYSLCQNHPEQDIDLYVAYHDLREQDFQRMEQIFSAFRNKRIHRIDVGAEFSQKVNANDQFSHESYYRILALEYLPDQVERILYLDADMLVKGDLSEVYDSPFSQECPFKVCIDFSAYRDNAFDIQKHRAQIPTDYKYFNSGFMLINMSYIRKRRSVGYIVDAFCREYKNYIYHDQDILNHMYYDRVEFVPWALYNILPGYWYLDTQSFAQEEIRFATYKEINSGSVKGNSRYVDMSQQMLDNARIIHFLWILKPWFYNRETIYADIKPWAECWYAAHEAMYQQIPELERLRWDSPS